MIQLTPKAQAYEQHKDWYDKSQHVIAKQAGELGVPAKHFAAVLAITSPRVPVKRNWRLAVTYLQTGQPASDTLTTTRAALAHWEKTGEIKGQKTRSFYEALCGNPEAVVLDVWMAKLFDVDPMTLRNKSVHGPLSNRIRSAAKRLNWEPRQVQAALWAYTIESSGRTVPEFL